MLHAFMIEKSLKFSTSSNLLKQNSLSNSVNLKGNSDLEPHLWGKKTFPKNISDGFSFRFWQQLYLDSAELSLTE